MSRIMVCIKKRIIMEKKGRHKKSELQIIIFFNNTFSVAGETSKFKKLHRSIFHSNYYMK